MRASYVAGRDEIAVGSFPVPEATEAGELVVQMQAASICGSDIHAVFDGFLKPEGVGRPGYPGHEGVGIVVDSRSDRFAPGTPVLTVPVVGGCFGEYQLIHDSYVVALPRTGNLSRLLMAQQFGTTLFAMRKFCRSTEGGTLAIIGAGSAGLFFVQQARTFGFERVVISDLNAGRLEVATSLGADECVHAPHESLLERVEDVTNGEGADLVIEAVGLDALRADAIEAVRPNGTVGCFGFPEQRGMADFPMFAAYRKSVTMQLASGTQAEPGLRAFHDAVQQIHEGEIEVDYALGHQFPLEEIPEAMALARTFAGPVKLVVTIGDAS